MNRRAVNDVTEVHSARPHLCSRDENASKNGYPNNSLKKKKKDPTCLPTVSIINDQDNSTSTSHRHQFLPCRIGANSEDIQGNAKH